jgi:hypothetical protein
LTYIGGNTADDDLFLAGGLDGGTEVGVVPGVDLTISANDGMVGVQFSDLWEERTVGAWRDSGDCPTRGMTGKKITLILARGDDNREIVGLAKCGVEDDVVVHFRDVVVTDGTDEAHLVLDDEQRHVVPIDSFERVCSD